MTLLQHAMRAERGSIDGLEGKLIYENPYLQMTRDSFVFDTPGGARFRYDRGGMVKLDNPSPKLDDECRLYQWGTVYGAVAWMNGLIPLHASCVTDGDRSVAFTAQSGVGKSTLAASLTQNGWRSVCDDTLVMVRNSDAFFALPDHKPAKLSAETARALGLDLGEAVPFSSGKFYVELPRCAAGSLPIGDLILLEDGPEFTLSPLRGAQKLEMIGSSLYRGFIHSALHSDREHAEMMLQLAAGLNCWKLTRPKDRGDLVQIAEQTDRLLNRLEN